MKERTLFVGAAKQKKTSFTSLCTAFGIAPKTGYKWLGLFEREGLVGLQERSRRPRGNSRAISYAMKTRLVALREDHPTWGPRKLVAWLAQHETEWTLPAPSTVGDLLKSRGLVAPPRQRLRGRGAPQSAPLRHATGPNAVWAMDFKGWFRVGDGDRCDPLTITDAYSRYLLCCDAHEEQFGVPVWESLVRTFREHGLPDAMRVDNGQPWVAPKGDLGLTFLAVQLMKLGITLERIAPGKPQQNGRHERFHLTLKQETANPPAQTLKSQQQRFRDFQLEYNRERPHEALGQRPPSEFFKRSLRKYPTRMPKVEYAAGLQTYRVGVSGNIHLRGEKYFVTSALRGEPIGLLEVEEGCFAVYFSTSLLGHLHAAHPELGLLVPQRALSVRTARPTVSAPTG